VRDDKCLDDPCLSAIPRTPWESGGLVFGAGMLLPGNFFSEGITPAHGHRGDNAGREAVLARILGGSLSTRRIPSQGSR
jgi:hypothetical protein